MTFRTDDDRRLLLAFLAWITPINADKKSSADEDIRIVEEFIRQREEKG